ncbi:hypothetical protein N9J77_00760 [bacterium]|nr:hypothetical protein [bacterium]|tara:strand:+ start:275 stop:871 length:597 start_codon:yes stop_codon:yes gene_type:complete
MDIVEIYKKQTLISKIIFITLIVLTLISLIELLYSFNTYTCYPRFNSFSLTTSENVVSFNGIEFSSEDKCISSTKSLFLNQSLTSVFFSFLLIPIWFLVKNIYIKNLNKFSNFMNFFEINRFDRGLFRIWLVLGWFWLVFVCILMMAEIPDYRRYSNDVDDTLYVFLSGLFFLAFYILVPLVWLSLKKITLWISRGFK